ncbi:MAG: hypothetical protein AAB846_02505 [Patescibacteria group bacterium]
MKKSFFALLLVLAVAAAAPSSTEADHSALHTIELTRAQITALQAKLAALLKEQETPEAWCHTFNVNLGVGAKGEEVGALEQALALEGFAVEHGSNFAPVFNERVASAVTGFQQKYRDEVLKPAGLTYSTGFVGRFTRNKLNALYGCKKQILLPPPPVIVPLPPPPVSLTPPPPAIIAPTVKILPSSAQPAATRAVRGAIVPFINVTISPESPVTFQDMTIEQTGLVNTAVFDSVALIANSSAGVEAYNTDRIVAWGKLDAATRKATLTAVSGFRSIAGLTEFTVAGVMASDLSSYAGETVNLSVTGAKFVSTDGRNATVPQENLPIQGAAQTIDNSLTIGGLSVKTVNDINSGRRMDFRASLAEDIRLYKIVFKNGGNSISVEGIPYTCSTVGVESYKACDLGTGVTIPKGTAIQVIPSGLFDTPSPRDIVAYGKTHGYRLSPVIMAETASGPHNLASVLAGFRVQLEALSKVLQSLKLGL